MRPKKTLLVVDSHELNLSVLSYTLSINGYRVLAATEPADAIMLFTENAVDLVLAADILKPDTTGDQLIVGLKALRRPVPMVLLGDPAKMNGKPYAADALLDKKKITSTELLERVKIWSARKRGPRKGFARSMMLVTA